MVRWYVFALSLVVMLLATGCFVINPARAPAGKLEVLEHSLTRESNGVQVQVTVKNVGSTNIELAQVRVNFFTEEGNLVDSSSDAVMNLKPDEKWDFVIACTVSNCDQVDNYEIETMAGTSSGG